MVAQTFMSNKEKVNPFQDRDLTVRLAWPTLSWSSLNSFANYDREEWYTRYVLGVRGEVNPAMLAGIEIGERWATDETYMPEVERPEIFEQELFAKLSGIQLTGHIDGLHLTKKKKLQELKTSQSSKRWTPKTVRTWGQIDFYCLLLWLNYKIKPEELEIELIYVPVVASDDGVVQRNNQPPVVIPTERTMRDMLLFAEYIKKTYKEMEEYVKHKTK